jgi:hypothetical protein
MKTLNNGEQIASRIFYYLLDWNDSNEFKLYKVFNKQRLHDFTLEECILSFMRVVESDVREYRINTTESESLKSILRNEK